MSEAVIGSRSSSYSGGPIITTALVVYPITKSGEEEVPIRRLDFLGVSTIGAEERILLANSQISRSSSLNSQKQI